MTEFQQAFGANVRRIRKWKGMTQQVLAERSKLSERYISEIERGIANPRVSALKELAVGLDVSVADLFIIDEGLVTANDIRQRFMEILTSASDDSIESLYMKLLSSFKTEGMEK